MSCMPTLGAWLHNIDPFAIQFTPSFGLRWYGLSYVAGFVAAWWILLLLARRGKALFAPEKVADLLVAVVVGTLVGGRLGYVLFYNPPLLADFRPAFPWWGALAIHEGGMASHGGMIGIVIAAWIFARGNRLSPLHVMDALAFVAPVGIFLGRIANFINGELLGRIVAPPGAPAPWWAVRYPQEMLEPRHAPQLSAEQAEALGELVLSVSGSDAITRPALERVITSVQAGDATVAARLAPLLSARHPSQLYQAFAEGILLGLGLLIVWARPRVPGVVTAWFLIAYGVGRVITEIWRLPDAHLSVPRLLGLSRGQWLSVAMVLIGTVLLIVLSRSKRERIGGWSIAGATPAATR